MRGPKPEALHMNEVERKELEQLVRRHSTPQQQALRGRMILAAADGSNNSQIGRRAGSERRYGAHLAHAVDQLASGLVRRCASQRASEGYSPSRTAFSDYSGTNLSDDGDGLRTTKGATHQPLDGPGNRRRA